MIIKKSVKTQFKLESRFFVHVGFIFSLVVMLFILALMRYFSAPQRYSLNPIYIAIPVELGMANDIKQITLIQQQSAPPSSSSAPTTSVVDIVADDMVADKEVSDKPDAGAKTDTPDNKLSGNGLGDNTAVDVEEPTPFSILEDQPGFPGGMEAMLKFLSENIKYPSKAKSAGISGTVIVSFVVEKDGTISTVKLVHGIGGGCNEEAIRVVGLMPKWSPGKQRGRAVRTQFQVPLIFFLRPR